MNITYTKWDKKSPVNGVEAIDILGQEQMDNDDEFLLIEEDGVITSQESVNILRSVLGLKGDTWDDIGKAYIVYRQNETPTPSPIEDRLAWMEDAMNAVIMGGM